MARIFTAEFQYKEATYTALITHTDGSIAIYVPHNELHSLIPNGRAVYSLDKGLELNSPQITEYQDIMVAILASIDASGILHRSSIVSQKGKEA